MSFVSSVTRKVQFWRPQEHNRETVRRSSPPCVDQTQDKFVRSAAGPDTSWWKGRPLSEARNAHSTNTKEHFDDAIKSSANWLEGDIRKEINSDKLEMRHDPGHEAGDNLTLKEWLQKGKESGRGLKLDVKEGQHIGRILDETAAANIPSERLMFNLGDADMKRWGPEIRERFPNATLAVNPPSGDGPDGKLSRPQVDSMIANAKAGGHPVTFVVKHTKLTDDAIERLRAHGTVSVWNSPGDTNNVDETVRNLRARGVDGVIDIRPPLSLGDKIDFGVDKATSWAKDRWDSIF